MTYQVLARKWRPKDFASLVGQEHVVRALTHALDGGRLHHAYLFTGTRGVGKTTLSRIFAKALNCETGVTSAPCGVCRACREIDEGRFVDYVEMDAASNRGVDEMAALLERAVYAPVDARFKVYMIDEVHMLTNHAFNAMLKTLEEPPAHVKFILATTDPQKIPVTVLSRCLQFNLKQMPAGHIVSHLEHILGEEKVPYDVQALRLLARAADGSMRDALSLTDQAIAYSANQVNEEAVRGMLGALDQSYLIRLLDALADGDGAAVLSVADEMALRSLSFSTALQDLASLLHRIAWAQFAPSSVLDEWPEAGDLRRFAEALSAEQVQLFYQIATIGRSELGLAPDEYAGFTMTLLRMLAFEPAPMGGGGAVGAARAPGQSGAGGARRAGAPAVAAQQGASGSPVSQARPVAASSAVPGTSREAQVSAAAPGRETQPGKVVVADKGVVVEAAPVESATRAMAQADSTVEVQPAAGDVQDAAADSAQGAIAGQPPVAEPAIVAEPAPVIDELEPTPTSAAAAAPVPALAPWDDAPVNSAAGEVSAAIGLNDPASSDVSAAAGSKGAASNGVSASAGHSGSVANEASTSAGLNESASSEASAIADLNGAAQNGASATATLNDETRAGEAPASSLSAPAAAAFARTEQAAAAAPSQELPPVADTAPRRAGGASAALDVLRSAGLKVSSDRGRASAATAAKPGAPATPKPAAPRVVVPVPTPGAPRRAPQQDAAPAAPAARAAGSASSSLAHRNGAEQNGSSVPPWDDMPPPDEYMPLTAADEGYYGLPDDGYMPVFDSGPDDVRVSAAPAPASTPAPAPVIDQRPLPPAVPLDPLGFKGDWPALAVDLPLKGISYQLAFNSELMALEGNTLKLNVPVPQYAEASQVAKLKTALADRLGQTVEVLVEVGPARRTAAAHDAAMRAQRQQQAEREIGADPFVQSLIREFGASIVPGSVRPITPDAGSNGAPSVH
ncbi:DNA polymerase III subunit gamma/tau [Paraburkholderia sp. USG1]|uniref:DNA polymerase III subunit gamma/tau n=1 Tax=Paraburkholderia sp. USG1 TaxID=2952268 RepID=UPI00285AC0B6|nr:DNA polymerase III subunit gamma/tau [Paraburkholderia sp. USG1]MDR8398784.1 DNA polymerase III subunit gamma/tau [Paraburkholderia sp. USG1]